MPAPPPFQMTPMQFAQPQPGIGQQLQQLGKGLAGAAPGINNLMAPTAQQPGVAVPGAVGPSSVGGPAGPAPLQQPSGVQGILNSMSPPQILDWLKTTTSPQVAQAIMPNTANVGLPGSNAINGAGMLGAGGMGSLFGG